MAKYLLDVELSERTMQFLGYENCELYHEFHTSAEMICDRKKVLKTVDHYVEALQQPQQRTVEYAQICIDKIFRDADIVYAVAQDARVFSDDILASEIMLRRGAHNVPLDLVDAVKSECRQLRERMHSYRVVLENRASWLADQAIRIEDKMPFKLNVQRYEPEEHDE